MTAASRRGFMLDMHVLLTMLVVLALLSITPLYIVAMSWGNWRRIRFDLLEYAQVLALYIVPGLLAAGGTWLMTLAAAPGLYSGGTAEAPSAVFASPGRRLKS